MCIKYNRVTKVRSRQAVKLPAVQPIVMTTGTLACPFFRILEKNEEEFIFLEFVFISTK